jgi:hypothetical protein
MTREGMVRELDRGEVSEREKVYVLDMLVTHGIVFGDPAVRRHLDDWSRQTLALGPGLPTLRGSRGAALVECGCYEEARLCWRPSRHWIRPIQSILS